MPAIVDVSRVFRAAARRTEPPGAGVAVAPGDAVVVGGEVLVGFLDGKAEHLVGRLASAGGAVLGVVGDGVLGLGDGPLLVVVEAVVELG